MSSKPQKVEWKWDETELKYPADTTLLVNDIKQIAITRGANKRDLNKLKASLITYVVSNFDVDLTDPLEKLTNKQLLVELKLRGLNHKIANKAILISRLREESRSKKQNDSNSNDNDKWLLQRSPSSDYGFYGAMKMDNNHICVGTANGFCKYNVVTKQWKSCLNFSENYYVFKDYRNITACFDNMNKTVFVYYNNIWIHNTSKLLNIDINSHKVEIIIHSDRVNDAKLAILNGQLHVIGKENYIWKHFILDRKKKQYSLLHRFEDISVESAELIAVPSRNMLLLIGGNEDKIYIYSSITHKWSTSALKLPQKITKFAHALSMNERYLFLFGGKKTDSYWRSDCDGIYIIDLNVMNIRKSKICCPLKSDALEVVICHNILEQKSIVFGYIRKCWKSDQFSMMMMPPDYIIRLILSWYSRENIHLFDKQSLMHCILNIDNICRDL